MHDELPLLINIAVSLVAAFLGGVIARRIGLPTIVGSKSQRDAERFSYLQGCDICETTSERL